jgi:hypothetical protein
MPVRTSFPHTATDEVRPTSPRDEPTRAEVNAHPENLAQRMQRTRRYFRLMRRGRATGGHTLFPIRQ